MKNSLFITLCLFFCVSTSIRSQDAETDESKPFISVENISTKDLDKDVAKVFKRIKKSIIEARENKDFETELMASKQWCLLLHNYNFLSQAKDCYFAVGMYEKSDAKWPYLYGKAALDEGNYNDAIKGFDQTLVRDNYYFPAHYYLIEIYKQSGNIKQAFLQKSKVPVELLLISNMLLLTGDLYFETENHLIAIGFYQQALNLVPKATSINYKLAQAYNLLGETQKAQAYLQLAGQAGIQLNDPFYFEVKSTIVGEVPYLIEAKTALSNNAFDKAIASYKKALEFNPESQTAQANLAVAYFQNKQTEQAKQVIFKLLENNPLHEKSLYNLAEIYLSENNINDAIKYFEEYRKLNLNDTKANSKLAQLYYANQQYLQVIKIAEESAMKAHEPTQVYKAKSLINTGEYSDAIEWLKKIHKYKPENHEVIVLLAKLLAQIPDESLRDRVLALEYAQLAVVQNKSIESLWLLMMALDENSECEQLQQQATELTQLMNNTVDTVRQEFSKQRGLDFKCEKQWKIR